MSGMQMPGENRPGPTTQRALWTTGLGDLDYEALGETVVSLTLFRRAEEDQPGAASEWLLRMEVLMEELRAGVAEALVIATVEQAALLKLRTRAILIAGRALQLAGDAGSELRRRAVRRDAPGDDSIAASVGEAGRV